MSNFDITSGLKIMASIKWISLTGSKSKVQKDAKYLQATAIMVLLADLFLDL